VIGATRGSLVEMD